MLPRRMLAILEDTPRGIPPFFEPLPSRLMTGPPEHRLGTAETEEAKTELLETEKLPVTGATGRNASVPVQSALAPTKAAVNFMVVCFSLLAELCVEQMSEVKGK